MIIDKLISQINEKQSPIVVGLDTTLDMIPNDIKQQYKETLGDTIEAAVESIWQYNINILNKIHKYVSVIKINPSCYELYGFPGLGILEMTIFYAKKLNLLVILDSKKNDISHTADLYAKAAFGKIPLIGKDITRKCSPDFITINPYLGKDGIDPFIKEAKLNDKGVFILCRTSNPSADQYQKSKVFNECASIRDDYLYEKIAKDINNHELNPKTGYSFIGAVVAANDVKILKKIRQKAKHNYFLVPGYGTQGYVMDDIIYAFNNDGYGALVHSSRSILTAYKNDKYNKIFLENDAYIKAAAQEVKNMRENILKSLIKANKLPNNW